MRHEAIAIFESRARKWRNLVDALDLGSSGAIRGGSSPPFRMTLRHLCNAGIDGLEPQRLSFSTAG